MSVPPVDCAVCFRKVNFLKFIVQLVQSLGMKITAEGVEYKEQLDFLENLNCDDIQGFYFSKPLMLADFSAKLTENN